MYTQVYPVWFGSTWRAQCKKWSIFLKWRCKPKSSWMLLTYSQQQNRKLLAFSPVFVRFLRSAARCSLINRNTYEDHLVAPIQLSNPKCASVLSSNKDTYIKNILLVPVLEEECLMTMTEHIATMKQLYLTETTWWWIRITLCGRVEGLASSPMKTMVNINCLS